jgi:hypothetical protein
MATVLTGASERAQALPEDECTTQFSPLPLAASLLNFKYSFQNFQVRRAVIRAKYVLESPNWLVRFERSSFQLQ